VAGSLNALGVVHFVVRDYAAAEPLYREALAMRRKLLGNEHPDIADSLNNLAATLFEERNYAGAEPLYREALAMRRKLLGNAHADVGTSLAGLAEVLAYQHGRAAEAEAIAREALAIRRKALPDGHPDIADSERVLGTCLAQERRYAEAEPLLLASYTTFNGKRGSASKEAQDCLGRIVALYEAWGKPDKAAPYKALLRSPATKASAK